MSREKNEETHEAIRSARVTVGLVFVGSVVSLAFWPTRGLSIRWQWWMAIGASFTLGVFVALKKKIRVTTSGLISFTCAMFVLFASSFSIFHASLVHLRTEPFLAYQDVALVFAVVAIRPMWMGYLTIILCGVAPIALYYSIFSALHANMPVQEPWITAIFSFICVVLYRYRIRSRELERDLASTRAREESMVEIAKVVLALRDLSNTPLQTLTATTSMLRDEHSSKLEIAEINEKALEHLRELSQVLGSYEKRIDWSQIQGSFDAAQLLKEVLGKSHHP